jgi:hypothetical protein
MPTRNTIVNQNLAGATIAYNGVQFGGADAPAIVAGHDHLNGLPPTYAFSGAYRYDSSGRSIIAVDYLLTVRCIFFEDSVSRMTDNMNKLRLLLSQPGQVLSIEGLGCGLGVIAGRLSEEGATPDYAEIDNGPHPTQPQMEAIAGALAWQLTWSVRFSIVECASSSPNPLSFLAFNFSTTWQNNFEGIVTRTIEGHVVIPQLRDPDFPRQVIATAENTRGNIFIALPTGFERIANVWRESEDKSRLNFSIVDQQIEGDNLPPDITAATGNVVWSSNAGQDNLSMVQSIVTMRMSLKTAPGKPRNRAGQLFMAAALSKQQELMAVGSDGKARITVMPIALSIGAGQFSQARQTDCSISWLLINTIQSTSDDGSMAGPSGTLNAVNLWEPLGDIWGRVFGTDYGYSGWLASTVALRDNRGTAQITSTAAEGEMIDLCEGRTVATIGVTGSQPITYGSSSLASLSCPNIPDHGGWVHFRQNIEIYRDDYATTHRKAATYMPPASTSLGADADPQAADSVSLPGPAYSQSGNDNHVTEFHGYPRIFVGVAVSALRFKYKPRFPNIKSVKGNPVVLKEFKGTTPVFAFNAFGCPVWRLQGYAIYEVIGAVPDIKGVGTPMSGDVDFASPYEM